MDWIRFFGFIAFFSLQIHLIFSVTDSRDEGRLQALQASWQNTPPTWRTSVDPCSGWEGVICTNERVTELRLPSMRLRGTLPGDIGGLTELRSLVLSFNVDLTGSLTPQLGNLRKLETLILAGCRFTGSIPDELGNLEELTFLALNSNRLSGSIPHSLGRLSKLYWFDVAENQLTGSIPVSTSASPGLDLLKKCEHFHFNKNRLSGTISPQLFSSDMILLHVLFDGNQLTGTIPESLGLVRTLEVIRLDRNALTGEVPSSLNSLTSLNELHLAHNRLTGPFPDLSDLSSLNYVDLSNNTFDASVAPDWFSTISSLTTLVVEYGTLEGPVPSRIFSSLNIQQVLLRNNAFNDTLDLGDTIGSELQLIDLENNRISQVTMGSEYGNTLTLAGNPVCERQVSNINYCQVRQPGRPYSTSLANCNDRLCPVNQKLSPQSCECAYPYEGTLYFRGPSFRDLSNVKLFPSLEMSLWSKLGLTSGSIYLENPSFNVDDYLEIQLALFPPTGRYFNRSEIQRIGFELSNQTYKPPDEFGPYLFIAAPYIFPEDGTTFMSAGVIAGIAVAGVVLIVGLIVLGIYAIRQKRRAEKAIGLSRPFASWVPSGEDGDAAPQLKGARRFSCDELKKSTNNFSKDNEIGSGGYGRVYRGVVADGQVVAIKRAQQGSMQGGLEFKTEIELLSRVHHKNLVSLIGFCFEQGEQMLVYEFMPNGTLWDSLSGKRGNHLDWKRRLWIAVGSARGLTYLHELANPPIIHRDVKSTNILLDDNLAAKVADFGLSKLVSDSAKGHVTTQVKGTLGYLDPEYYMTQQLSEKSDVYSFGVVMLELITAKQPIEKGKYIVREIRTAMDKSDEEYYGLRELLDPTIKSMTLIGFTMYLELAMKCVKESAADRPTMSEVVKAIENILQMDGMNTDLTSASSSATDFPGSKGVIKDIYGDALPNNSDAFDYSGGYAISVKVEPK